MKRIKFKVEGPRIYSNTNAAYVNLNQTVSKNDYEIMEVPFEFVNIVYNSKGIIKSLQPNTNQFDLLDVIDSSGNSINVESLNATSVSQLVMSLEIRGAIFYDDLDENCLNETFKENAILREKLTETEAKLNEVSKNLDSFLNALPKSLKDYFCNRIVELEKEEENLKNKELVFGTSNNFSNTTTAFNKNLLDTVISSASKADTIGYKSTDDGKNVCFNY